MARRDPPLARGLLIAALAMTLGCTEAPAVGAQGQVWRSTYSVQARRTVTGTIDADGRVALRGIDSMPP